MKINTNFLKSFDREMDKIDGVTGSSEPPRYWYSFGNYVLNRVMSGSYFNGAGQGRITGLVGPSGSGKSYVAANLAREAQSQGTFVLVVDSENAMDDEFMTKVGVNVNEDYLYKSVITIPHVTKIVSRFIKGYVEEYGTSGEAPRVLIIIDSLDMLLTETETKHFKDGVTKGDQGQRNKQLKAMLRTFVQSIKELNIAMVVTDQVYRNQDITNGEGVWVVKDAVKYALSQICLLTKLKLKKEGDKLQRYDGIRMKGMGAKTRFTKPFQYIEIEVPYDSGMNPFSGLLDVAVQTGVVSRGGAWYTTKDGIKFQSKNFEDHAFQILEDLEEANVAILAVSSADEDDDQVDA